MNARETAKADARLEFEATVDRSAPIDQWHAALNGFDAGYEAGYRNALASLQTAAKVVADALPVKKSGWPEV
jgi:hypothetical protein